MPESPSVTVKQLPNGYWSGTVTTLYGATTCDLFHDREEAYVWAEAYLSYLPQSEALTTTTEGNWDG